MLVKMSGMEQAARHGNGYGRLLGASLGMRQLFELIDKASQSDCPVLIQGETGTGKELVARSIHLNGPRADRPFLPVDCAALAPTLIESELFGYVRGAFTGAVYTKPGLLQAAQGGTVFFDEIGELPVDLQAKLLRALQEKEVRPVGSTRCVKFDARIIAATNRDLEAAIEQGTFRKDLYFRLNVVSLRLPRLRERKSDIPLLGSRFLEKFRQPGQPCATLSEEAMAKLMAYDWPGNVRELENCIERAVALARGPVLEEADISVTLRKADERLVPELPAEEVVPLREVEKIAILRAVIKARGDKLLAARLLGIGKTTLYRKLKEYGWQGAKYPIAESGIR